MGKKYTCAGKGPGGRYVLIPHSGRVNKYFSAEQLFDLHEQNKISFHENDGFTSVQPDTIFSISSLPNEQRDTVLMRHFYMTELDSFISNGGKLSVNQISDFAIKTHKAYLQVCRKQDRPIPSKPMAESTVRRWYRAWKKSGRNIVSLLHNPSGNRHSKLTAEQRWYIEEGIKSLYLTKQRLTIKSVHEYIAAKIDIENRDRVLDGLAVIPTPSYQTLCNHIKELDQYERLSARFGHEYAYKMTRNQGITPLTKRHLEKAQADHTQLDVYCDVGIGILVRPWLTLITDSYSKSILGFWISPEHPSADTVMKALRCAALPKDFNKLQSTTTLYWPMFGLPQELILDNGKDFIGRDLQDAAAELSITLTFAPPRQPYYKAQIERKFGEINKRLLAKLPSQVFKYEPEKYGLDFPHLTFEDLRDIFIQWVTTIAHHTPTQDGYTPNQLWLNSLQKHGSTSSGIEQGFIEVCLSKTSERKYTIQADGIHFNNLIFNNEWLSRYRNKIASHFAKGNPKVEFKWSETDVGTIWVFDQLNRTFFPVKSKQTFAHGRSQFNHNVNLREQRNRKKNNLSDSNYHDSVIALDRKIESVVITKGNSKLPANVAKYIRGAPQYQGREKPEENQERPVEIYTSTSQDPDVSHTVTDDIEEIETVIDDIPDELEI
jgi:putative transposase